jgi:asparagine synthase (glutamine-hydrolysing)
VEVEGSDCLNALEDVVYATETFDVTTIRASTPMYLLSKYIRQKTEDVVIYSGEGADEVTQGYLYFKKQPSSKEGALESKRLMDQLYEFDVLRVDRTTAAHGLEVREPFLDKEFMQHYFNLPANIKCPRHGIEKYHLRKAIDVTFPDLLPEEILWRQKEAFSDGVSSFKKKSWVEELKEHADSVISDQQFEYEAALLQPTPKFKDALLLRQIYNKFYGHI